MLEISRLRQRLAFFKFVASLGLLMPISALAQNAVPVAGAEAVRATVQQTGTIRVIARVSPRVLPEGVEMAGAALENAQAQLSSFMSKQDVSLAEPISGLPLVVLELAPGQLEALLASGRVDAVQEDTIEQAYLADSVPLINAPQVWNHGARGAGQAVAILDTGVDRTHPFLGGRVVSEACFSSNSAGQGATTVCPNGQTSQIGTGAAAPCAISSCDHGTHVAGIAAGNDANFSGVAPDAPLIAIQIFSLFTDQPGGPQNCANANRGSPCILTFSSDQIRGLQRVSALAATMNIAAANMSLGGGRFTTTCDGDLRKDVIDQLRGQGIATAIASGNDGFSDAVGKPGCISTAVTVGSTTKADTVSGFSNSSAVVDLLAPGSSINSSVTGGGFDFKSGTSMATPHVAGAFAVLRSGQQSATVNAIQNALASTGVPITDPRNNLVRPRIDVGAALGQFVPIITLVLADPGSRLGNGDTMGVTASLTQAGAPIPGATVNFNTADTNLLTVSPASGTSGASGAAQATIRGETSWTRTTTTLTASSTLAAANASDSRGVLVPDLSFAGFAVMIAGVAMVLVLSSRRRGSD